MSYEECARHVGEEATNGCEKCMAEELEQETLNLDNFLADHFGGDGKRETTIRFLNAFEEAGFLVLTKYGDRISWRSK
jgi:hypothetical protein